MAGRRARAVHGMDATLIFMEEGDVESARALVDSTADAELFLYPGDSATTSPDAACRRTARTLAELLEGACSTSSSTRSTAMRIKAMVW